MDFSNKLLGVLLGAGLSVNTADASADHEFRDDRPLADRLIISELTMDDQVNGGCGNSCCGNSGCQCNGSCR